MATQQTTTAGRLLVAPSVILLFLWMIVPLVMTLYFSALNYNLLNPESESFIGFRNYLDFLSDPDFLGALVNTLILVVSVLVLSVVGGILVALLMDQPIFGQNIVRVMVIAPFFVMPTVSGLIWKNMLMNPVSGLFAWIANARPAGDRLVHELSDARDRADRHLAMAAVRQPDSSDGAAIARRRAEGGGRARRRGPISFFFYIVLPHIARAITVVVLIETIFLLNVFAEIRVTTNGGPSTTNLPFRIFELATNANDVGGAAAGGIVAVVLANIVAIFLVRMIGKNLEA